MSRQDGTSPMTPRHKETPTEGHSREPRETVGAPALAIRPAPKTAIGTQNIVGQSNTPLLPQVSPIASSLASKSMKRTSSGSVKQSGNSQQATNTLRRGMISSFYISQSSTLVKRETSPSWKTEKPYSVDTASNTKTNPSGHKRQVSQLEWKDASKFEPEIR